MAATTDTFLLTLQTSPQSFLQPSLPLYTDSIAYLKHILDPLAKDVSAEQQRRQQDARKKRKRGQSPHEEESVLRLKQIHAEGFGMQQVWEQARRVIDAARVEAERSIAELKEFQNTTSKNENLEEDLSGSDVSVSDLDEDLGVEGVDYEVEGPDEDDLDEEEDEGSDINGSDLDMVDDYDELEGDGDGSEAAEEFVADRFGLNDGFFSIDDFNRQSEFLEQRDARGENDDAASDEEDIDWETNPLSNGGAAASTNGVHATEESEEEEHGNDDDDDTGPTFGDPDASSEDEDDIENGELDDIGGMSNANDVMYADFFAPPAKKKSKKPKPKKTSGPEANGVEKVEATGNYMQRTMDAVHRDLFEDDESEDEEEDATEEVDAADPRARRSTHERRRAAIAEEIRKLEAANVAKREWMLSGEARAADRPMNSLLEQDLDFERAGKPVLVVTAEVSESIEELIKRRILAHDFQDIIRRRPDDLATGKDARRGRLDFELDDSKSKKGLAEEYEEEHLRRTDPNFVDAKDEKLSKEQKEIDALWREVSGQLDSLSSWHFRPKQPVAQLDIRVDAPTVTMEDARPNAGGAVAGASQLAPQEVYRAGEASKGAREEVVGKDGLPTGREELSREEKRRRRRRDKERARKAGGNAEAQARRESKGAREKTAVLGELKRGGVKVIGRKGEVRDVDGRKVGDKGPGQGAARFKL